MKKFILIMLAAILSVSLSSCGDDIEENEKAYNNFKSYISENGIEQDYYIQISKTADSANVLTEAARLGNDCAFMEYDASGSIRYYRNNALTVISGATFYYPDTKDASWEDFEYESLNNKYRDILLRLIETDGEKSIERSNTDDKNMPYKYSVKYNPEELDTKSIFSNSGNFGIVSVKFESDKKLENFSEVTVSCQYDYDGVIYLYSVTFGAPDQPDSDGKNGQRPEDIQKMYESYKNKTVPTNSGSLYGQ